MIKATRRRVRNNSKFGELAMSVGLDGPVRLDSLICRLKHYNETAAGHLCKGMITNMRSRSGSRSDLESLDGDMPVLTTRLRSAKNRLWCVLVQCRSSL